MSSDVVLIADMSAIFHRYHATQGEEYYCEGIPVGGVLGTLKCLMKLQSATDARWVLAAFDGQRDLLARRKEFTDYKKSRVTDEVVIAGLDWLKILVPLMGAYGLTSKNQEADDIIGSAVNDYSNQAQAIIIAGLDKDLTELLDNPKVRMLHPTQFTMTDANGVLDKFGVVPRLMPDYLALLGDAADDIPGVDKIGSKTAAKLLNTYGSLEQLVAHAHDVKGVVGENLRKSSRQVLYFRDFLKLRRNLWVPTLGEIEDVHPERRKLLNHLAYLGFTQFAHEISLALDAESGPCP